jgi:hypothetical protein
MLEVVSGIGRHRSASLANEARPAGEITAVAARWVGICPTARRRQALAVDVQDADPTASAARRPATVFRGGWGRLGRIGFVHEIER